MRSAVAWNRHGWLFRMDGAAEDQNPRHNNGDRRAELSKQMDHFR
jgi:hypothetical protein